MPLVKLDTLPSDDSMIQTFRNVKIELQPNLSLLENTSKQGTIHFTSTKMYFASDDLVLSVDFPTISIHAVDNQAPPSVYCQLDVNPANWQRQNAPVEATEDESQLEEDTPMVELRLVPASSDCVEGIFLALSAGAAENPDPTLQAGEEETTDGGDYEGFYTAENIEELSAAGQAALEYLDNVFEMPERDSPFRFTNTTSVVKEEEEPSKETQENPQR